MFETLREKRKALERDRAAALAGAREGHDLSLAAFVEAIEELANPAA